MFKFNSLVILKFLHTFSPTSAINEDPTSCYHGKSKKGFQLVDKCSKFNANSFCLDTSEDLLLRNWNEDIQIASYLPVSIQGITGTKNYRNVFCAVCNGEINFDIHQGVFQPFRFWNFKIDCDDTWMNNVHRNPWRKNKMYLKSQFQEHCQMSEIVPPKLSNQTACLPGMQEKKNGWNRAPFWSPPSASVIITFDDSGESTIIYQDEDGNIVEVVVEDCEPGEVFDVFEQQCRSLFCKYGYKHSKNGCVKIRDDAVMNINITLEQWRMKIRPDWHWPVMSWFLEMLSTYLDYEFDVQKPDIKTKTPSLSIDVYHVGDGDKTVEDYGKARRFMEGLAGFISKVFSYVTNIKAAHYDVDISKRFGKFKFSIFKYKILHQTFAFIPPELVL